MAAEKKTSRVIDTWKAKKWYKVNAPVMFGSKMLGETIAVEDQNLLGRTAVVSLGTLTGDVKKQNTNATFEIVEVKAGNAETKLKKLEIAPSSIRRMIRKGKERVDLSIICATKDNVVVRVKPLLLTKGKTGGSLLTKMRATLEALLRVEMNKVSYEAAIQDIIANKFQRTIKARLNRLYPVKAVEVRSIEVTTTSKPLPPIPQIEELKEEVLEETEEEKLEKKVKAKKSEATEEVAEDKPKKAKKAKEAEA